MVKKQTKHYSLTQFTKRAQKRRCNNAIMQTHRALSFYLLWQLRFSHEKRIVKMKKLHRRMTRMISGRIWLSCNEKWNKIGHFSLRRNDRQNNMTHISLGKKKKSQVVLEKVVKTTCCSPPSPNIRTKPEGCGCWKLRSVQKNFSSKHWRVTHLDLTKIRTSAIHSL